MVRLTVVAIKAVGVVVAVLMNALLPVSSRQVLMAGRIFARQETVPRRLRVLVKIFTA